MKPHIAIYCRVSTKMQDIKSQLPALKRWAANQKQPVIYYHDHFSGKTMNRPGWNELEKSIQAGLVISIVVWKLDRLGRTTLGLLKLIEDELKPRKINLLSITEPHLELATPGGRKFFRDLASAAEYERELIGERIREGIAVARASGKTWGGSKKGVRKKVTPIQITAIRRMKQDGETILDIARAVGLSRPTIYSVLITDQK